MDRYRIRCLVNIFLVVAVAGSWLTMFFFGRGTLAQNGIRSLKYFTTLSNLFEGVASAIWLASSSKERNANHSGGRAAARIPAKDNAATRAETLKFVAATSVGLTCMTVLVFLGPMYGYPAMFEGASLFMHLLTPVAAILEVIFLSDYAYTRKDNRLVILPPLIYGVFYLGNVIVNGFGEWPDYNDWYLFLTWGYLVGILIFAIICVATWLMGLAIRKLQQKATRLTANGSTK